MALGKEVFAEYPLAGTRQTITAVTGNGRGERTQRTREAVCRVLPAWHSAKAGLPSVCKQALGKANLCRVSFCCRVSFGRHSANCNFAECSIYCSRQRLQHSANVGFPVVHALFVTLPQYARWFFTFSLFTPTIYYSDICFLRKPSKF